MLSLYRTLSLRYLRRRWSRAILIVVSITLGVAILVTKEAACLYDLVLRQRQGELPCEIPLVLSNHPTLPAIAIGDGSLLDHKLSFRDAHQEGRVVEVAG